MAKPRYIPTQYKPAELRAVLDMLERTGLKFAEASALVQTLRREGYRIIKTGAKE